MKSLKELFDIRETELTVQPKYKIYCDLDGVLADFDGQFEYYTGFAPKEYKETYGEKPFWDTINNIGEIYWSAMPFMPEGKLLWNFIRPYKPTILSSPSRQEESKTGKQKWVDRNLSPSPPLIFARAEQKHQYANKVRILIDDREDTIQRWRAAGGIGILCKEGNSKEVIEKLKELGYGR